MTFNNYERDITEITVLRDELIEPQACVTLTCNDSW